MTGVGYLGYIDSPELQYGDSPVCLDQDQRTDVHSGVTAITQGYGLTEFGTAGTLLETNVTVITTECRQILRSKATSSRITRNSLTISHQKNELMTAPSSGP